MSTAPTTRDLAKMKARIAQLLAQAESTTYEAERDTFNAAAEKLMLRLGIVRAELESIGEAKPEKVIEVRREYKGIHAIGFISFGHAILRGFGHVTALQSSYNRGRSRLLYLIGTESDVRELSQLLDSLELQVISALGRWRSETATDRKYMTAMDKELRDRSFISGFGSTVGQRLREARTVEEKVVTGTSTALVLVGKDERVQEYMNQAHPNLRHTTSRQGHSSAGSSAGRSAGAKADLGQKRVGGASRQIGG
jgi:hypothetical protein